MANLTKGHVFASGDTVTATKLNDLVDSATISAIQTADISDNQITTAKIVDGNVTDAKLATGAVTGAAGGGKLAASAITSQTAIDTLASDDTLLVHDDSNTALRKVTWAQIVAAAQPVGSVLQTVQSTNATWTTITSTIATNDTAPTSTDGTEILSQSITPASASNKVLVSFSGWFGSNGGQHTAVVCRGSTVIQTIRNTINNGDREAMFVEILDSPATTSATTYSVRMGSTSGQSLYMNGSSGSREAGGTSKATLTLQEIKG